MIHAHPTVQIQEEDINFFIESDDEWFFDGHNLVVTFNDGDDFRNLIMKIKKAWLPPRFFSVIAHISHTTLDRTFK